MRGMKLVENRTWSTKHRGRLVIHAGKSRGWINGPLLLNGTEVELDYGLPIASLTLGAVLGEVQLVDCVTRESIRAGTHYEKYPWMLSHEHVEGPWCWILADVKRYIVPVPWTGSQGLFDIDPLKLNAAANFQVGIREDEQ